MRSISPRSWWLARLMKGKSARLRARRMRLLMTISDSGPEPRSHSPLVVSVFEFHGAIPISGGRFAHRLLICRLTRRPGEPACAVLSTFRCGGSHRGVWRPARNPRPATASFISRRRRINWVRFSLPWPSGGPLAHVLQFAVDIEDQRLQLVLKAHVIVRAAQPALAAEIVERDPAHRAGLLVQLGQLLGRLPHGHLLHLLRQRARPCCRRWPARRWIA